MFDRILVPLDGSELAEAVMAHVVAVAGVLQSEVTLLQVVVSDAATDRAAPIDPVRWEIEKAEAQAYLGAWVERVQELGVDAKALVLEGRPASCIIEEMRRSDIDLIMLTTHGRSGLSSWNISSVVQKVIQRCGISLYLVRGYQPDGLAPGELHPQRILVPLDGSVRADCALAPAGVLARGHGARVVLGHIIIKPRIHHRAPLADEDTELIARVVDRSRAEVTEYLDHVRETMDLETIVRIDASADPAAALHKLIEEEEIDLVVMSAHGDSGSTRWPYGSVTMNQIMYGAAPVLVIQDLASGEIEPSHAERAAEERPGH